MLIALGLLSACASTVTVTGKIPDPLVPRSPLTVKMIYSDEFKRYNYEEKEKGRGLRSIAFGAAQVTLFDGIFSQLFNLADSNTPEVDMRITPSLLEFQYSAPRETRLNLYEIWLKYRLQVFDGNDKEVADLEIKGYGKTPTALLSSADKAFDLATNIALRDVGAQLAIRFPTQPEIEDFLRTHKKMNRPLADNNSLQPLNSLEQENSLERTNSPELINSLEQENSPEQENNPESVTNE